MKYKVTRIALYGKKRMEDRPVGAVHSVYEHAVNIKLNNELLCLQPAQTPMSPVTLLTNIPENAFRTLPVMTGDMAEVRENMLVIKNKENIEFIWDDSTEYVNLGLSRENKYDIINVEQFIEQAEEMLRNMHTGGMRQAIYEEKTEDLLSCRIVEILKKNRECLENNRWEACAETLCRFIGLGIGLTPSGDDFLCGVLAGLTLEQRGQKAFACELRREIMNNLGRTNEISQTFLKCAAADEYSEAVQMIFKGNTSQALKEMRKIGHSSGMDTLCGIIYASKILKNIQLADEEE